MHIWVEMAGERAGLVRALLWRVVGEEMLGAPLLLPGGRLIRGGWLPNPRETGMAGRAAAIASVLGRAIAAPGHGK